MRRWLGMDGGGERGHNRDESINRDALRVATFPFEVPSMRFCVVLLMVCVGLVWGAPAVGWAAEGPAAAVDELGGVREELTMVPMRDGVKLAVALYFPKGDGPWPVLMEQRYAGARDLGSRKAFAELARGGYVVALANFRGSQTSEGVWQGYRALGWGELKDGYDLVEWLAKRINKYLLTTNHSISTNRGTRCPRAFRPGVAVFSSDGIRPRDPKRAHCSTAKRISARQESSNCSRKGRPFSENAFLPHPPPIPTPASQSASCRAERL